MKPRTPKMLEDEVKKISGEIKSYTRFGYTMLALTAGLIVGDQVGHYVLPELRLEKHYSTELERINRSGRAEHCDRFMGSKTSKGVTCEELQITYSEISKKQREIRNTDVYKTHKEIELNLIRMGTVLSVMGFIPLLMITAKDDAVERRKKILRRYHSQNDDNRVIE